PAEKTSIENATFRHKLAIETISIGTTTRKSVSGRWRRIESVPPACEKAYQISATVISGSTQATMTTDPTTARTEKCALRSRSASSIPSTDWPTMAEPTTNRMVNQAPFVKT